MPGCLDLTGNKDVTVALLADPSAWRVRVVEQIDVDSPVSVLRRRSLQCAPLRPVLRELLRGPDREALLVLPYALVPKGPLLDFDVTGPGGSAAFLVQRVDIATREIALLDAMATAAGLPLPPAARVVVEAALGYTEVQWREFRPEIVEYLAEGTGRDVSSPDLHEWSAISREVGTLLAPFSDLPEPLDSAVENPALVVPSLVAGGYDAVGEALDAYRALVRQAALRPDETTGPFLRTLVRYGTHYDLMAVTRVPLDEPFLVKIADRRPVRLSPVLNDGEQSVALRDARSNHIALRVTDPNARLSKVEATTPDREDLAYGAFTARSTAQVYAFYAFEPDRDEHIALRFRVSTLRRLQLVPYAVVLALLVLSVAILVFDPSRRDVALVAAPATFAASILLAREPSALGSRLRRVSTFLVVAATGLLLSIAAWQFAVRGA
jgi:hypothetical protein